MLYLHTRDTKLKSQTHSSCIDHMIKLQIQTHSLCFTCTHELQIQTHSLYWTSYKKKERKLVTAIILLWKLQWQTTERSKVFGDPTSTNHSWSFFIYLPRTLNHREKPSWHMWYVNTPSGTYYITSLVGHDMI